MHTYNAIFCIYCRKIIIVFFAVIISINNQTRMITLKSVLNKNHFMYIY